MTSTKTNRPRLAAGRYTAERMGICARDYYPGAKRVGKRAMARLVRYDARTFIAAEMAA